MEVQDITNPAGTTLRAFEEADWMSFENNREGFSYIKKSFFDEHKDNIKNLQSKNRKEMIIQEFSDKLMIEESNNKVLNSAAEENVDLAYQTAIPSKIDYNNEFGTRIYNTRFTADGKKLLVTTQEGISVFKYLTDGQLEMADTAKCENISWTITDIDISTDNKYAVHSTLSPFVHMFDIEKGLYIHQFNLKEESTKATDLSDELFWFFSLKIYSLKISGDNKEIIAACAKTAGGAPIQIFDIETKKLKQSAFAHKEDINSVCYLDKSNPSIFISASDDGVCKLWDTRILTNFEPVGIFYGHVSGLAHVESKGDNRYFISSSKDQSIKLWDVRNCSTEKRNYPFLKYDYRYEILSSQHIDQIKAYQKRYDQSVMSYWGHQVHSTLIRCHFSPLHSTNQRYIYSGSYDGKIYVYDFNTGDNLACLDTVRNEEHDQENLSVRDCAWHPYFQSLVSGNFQKNLFVWTPAYYSLPKISLEDSKL